MRDVADEELRAYLDHGASPEVTAQLTDALRHDPALRKRLLVLAGFEDGLRTAFRFAAAGELDRAAAAATAEGEEAGRSFPVLGVERRIGRWLALAAGLALAVAGGWWFYPRLAGAPALGLRLVEIQGAVAVTHAGQPVPVSKGLALQDGDQVTVKEGSKAALKYEAEETTIALHSATASFRAEQGAKRVRLDSGLLVCTAAPQQQPFRLETPHAVAEVVGTRFSLDAATTMTTLAVQEGKVALYNKDNSRAVTAGESAVADAAGLRKLSPADAWIRELLARAETGPWDVVNLGTGVYSKEVWRMDARGGPAERRIWNMPLESDRDGMVIFRDGKRWARGVVTGRMMILPEGQAALEVGGGATATNIGWRTYLSRITNAPTALQKLRIAGAVFSFGPTERERNIIREILNADEHPAGVWYRYAVYFDTESPDMVHFVQAAWPEGTAMPLASTWVFEWNTNSDKSKVEIGLMAKGVSMVSQGLKFVPLGPDMPMPPKELVDRK